MKFSIRHIPSTHYIAGGVPFFPNDIWEVIKHHHGDDYLVTRFESELEAKSCLTWLRRGVGVEE